MEVFIIFIVIMILFFLLKYVFEANVNKLKEITQNEELNKIAEKYPENVDICKTYLKMLKNEDVKIEEQQDANTTMYFVMGNKIFIANLKNNFTN